MSKYSVERDDRDLHLSGEKYFLREGRGAIAIVYRREDAVRILDALLRAEVRLDEAGDGDEDGDEESGDAR